MAQTQIPERQLSVSDVTTNNVTITAHGFHPKLPNDINKTLGGTGTFVLINAASLGKTLAISRRQSLP